MSLDQHPIPQPGIVSQIVQEEAVIVLPHRGEVKVLNAVGARIWALADGTRSLRQISATIAAEYAVEQPQAEADTLAFVDDLAQRGLLRLT